MPKKTVVFLFICGLLPYCLSGMHIMEGFLPAEWAAGWWGVLIPFLIIGVWRLKKLVTGNPDVKILVAMAGAFVFFLSSLKLPGVAGSSSHPTGTGLGAILFGPWVMCISGFIVLIFQALLMSHGGLTTLGANTFSMGIAGPVVVCGIYQLMTWIKTPRTAAVFVSTACGNLATYTVTAVQLGIAYPDAQYGIAGSISKFLILFAFSQIPLAIVEGVLTVLVINLLGRYGGRQMAILKASSQIKKEME